MQILTKQQAYKLYEEGAFGNKVKTWNKLNDILKEDVLPEKVVMRYKGKPGTIMYNYGKGLSLEEAQDTFDYWVNKLGADASLITFNEGAPDERLLIQGEVCRTELHYNLTYSTIKDKMRVAMKAPLTATGLKALMLLKHHLWPSSYDDLQILFDIYPESVVEFSAYEISVGNIPYRNTIFWEVRTY